jgi:hypothetical protein
VKLAKLHFVDSMLPSLMFLAPGAIERGIKYSYCKFHDRCHGVIIFMISRLRTGDNVIDKEKEEGESYGEMSI